MQNKKEEILRAAAVAAENGVCSFGIVTSGYGYKQCTGEFQQLLETMPDMILIEDADMRLNLMGIRSEDCAQVVTAVCADGLRTDEVWLIEAKDAAALERIAAMAENRLFAKGEESITYSPEQYAVVQKAVTVTEGLYFAMIVSPDVDALKAVVDAAVK